MLLCKLSSESLNVKRKASGLMTAGLWFPVLLLLRCHLPDWTPDPPGLTFLAVASCKLFMRQPALTGRHPRRPEQQLPASACTQPHDKLPHNKVFSVMIIFLRADTTLNSFVFALNCYIYIYIKTVPYIFKRTFN